MRNNLKVFCVERIKWHTLHWYIVTNLTSHISVIKGMLNLKFPKDWCSMMYNYLPPKSRTQTSMSTKRAILGLFLRSFFLFSFEFLIPQKLAMWLIINSDILQLFFTNFLQIFFLINCSLQRIVHDLSCDDCTFFSTQTCEFCKIITDFSLNL